MFLEFWRIYPQAIFHRAVLAGQYVWNDDARQVAGLAPEHLAPSQRIDATETGIVCQFWGDPTSCQPLVVGRCQVRTE